MSSNTLPIDSPHTWRDCTFSDWTIRIDQQTYPVHRKFIARGLHCSHFFAHQFNFQSENNSTTKETNLSQLPIKSKQLWERVLDFFYSCDCKRFEIKINEVIPFCQISDYLQIPALKKLVDANFQNQVKDPTNALQFFLDSIDLDQDQYKIISQQYLVKNITLYSVESFSSIPFNDLENLLFLISEDIKTIIDKDVALKKNLFITKMVLAFLDNTENEVKKEDFEKLVKLVKETDRGDLVKMLVKINQIAPENTNKDRFCQKIVEQFIDFEVSLLSQLPTDIFINIIEHTTNNNTTPSKTTTKHKYNSIIQFLTNQTTNKDDLSSTQFDELMKHVNKVKSKDVGFLIPLCEQFKNTQHLSKCMVEMAKEFCKMTPSTLAQLSVERFIALMSSDELNVNSEDEVFQAIEYFIESKKISDHQIQNKLWSCCRFGYLSLKYLIQAQEMKHNISLKLILEGLTFSKFKSEVTTITMTMMTTTMTTTTTTKTTATTTVIDQSLLSLMENYQRLSKNPGLFVQRKPKKGVDVSLLKVVPLSSSAIKLKPFKVLVETFDIDKQPIKVKLDISIVSPNGSLVEKYDLKSENGKETIQFVPEMVGTYVINVKVEDKLIKGCPLSVVVVDPFVCRNKDDVLKYIKLKEPFIIEATSLDLGKNSIGDEGARAIAISLQGNNSLKNLYLPCK